MLGEITIAFNNIQKLVTEHVSQLQTEHKKLIERERLASLGQLIGGIAHNLRTPIISITDYASGIPQEIQKKLFK